MGHACTTSMLPRENSRGTDSGHELGEFLPVGRSRTWLDLTAWKKSLRTTLLNTGHPQHFSRPQSTWKQIPLLPLHDGKQFASSRNNFVLDRFQRFQRIQLATRSIEIQFVAPNLRRNSGLAEAKAVTTPRSVKVDADKGVYRKPQLVEEGWLDP